MTNVRALLVGGGLLLLGAGLIGGFAAGRHQSAAATTSSGTTYLERLATDYHLRPEQVDRIRAHLDHEQAAVDKILDGVEEQVKQEVLAARAETVQRIRGDLDPEQLNRFDEDRKRGS